MQGERQARERVFYGWFVVTAVFVVMAVSAGLSFYNLSVYLKAFITQEGFSISATSAATACFFIASGLTGLGVAALIDRFDPRWSISAGALISASVVLGAPYVTSLGQLYLFYVLLGVGHAFCALIPGTTLIARWFARRRSVALSTASTGLSVGGILITPWSAGLIDRLGFDGAVPWISLVYVLGILPITWALIRPSPESLGVGPDGDALQREEDGTPAQPDGVAFGPAMRSRFFIFCTLAYIFAMMAQVGALTHQFRLVATRTGSDDTGALAIAVMAGASIVGRLIGGWALTYIPSKPFVQVLMVVQAGALCFYAISDSATGLIAASALFGATVGNLLMMQPLILAEAFGLKAYARIYSVSQLATTLGVACGPALVGLLNEATESYAAGFYAIAGGSLVALTAMSLSGAVSSPLRAEAARTEAARPAAAE